LHWPPLPPYSEVVDVAKRVVLPAAGLAFAVPLAARRVFGPAALPIATSLGAALGLALAFNLRGAAPWGPEEFGSGWMHAAWAAALTAGCVAAATPVRWKWLPKLAAVSMAVWATLPGERRDGAFWFLAVAAAMAIPWLAAPTTDAATERRQRPERSVWLALALCSLSLVALYAHYLRVTDFAMMVACALAGGAAACALLGRDGRELEGLGYVSLPALALCLWNDVDSAIPARGFLCAGLAAAPMGGFRWLPSRHWRSLMVRGALVLLPAGIAVILAMSFEELSFG
jgi:hypothetical protein